ncbi:hypothetical protein F3Y22_tig00112959pilonHSYRG00023 [Hibiscus syriacus]|uniref:Uncharacterized protein n=1 Tax=Hibiscus syriacus TaxID=106335 RepID=A0A6A2WR86_HIBSY|nr:hypothetical protein F3Y22_tig00112959pilonHSYRG00023 [Hibiscus syriacus]
MSILHACSFIGRLRILQWVHGLVSKLGCHQHELVLNSIPETYLTNGHFTELQQSSVSVLDSSFYKEESSLFSVKKGSINFKEDDTWSSSAISSDESKFENKSDVYDFIYTSDSSRTEGSIGTSDSRRTKGSIDTSDSSQTEGCSALSFQVFVFSSRSASSG